LNGRKHLQLTAHTSNELNRVGPLNELIQLRLGDHQQRIAFATGMDDTVAKQIAVTESDNLIVSDSENLCYLLAGIRSLHSGDHFGLTFGGFTHVFIPPSQYFSAGSDDLLLRGQSRYKIAFFALTVQPE
jgi:hypothetical protein